MNDKQLCAEVARIWLDGGGDADGILHCLTAIRQAIVDEQSARYEEAKLGRLGEDMCDALRLQTRPATSIQGD